MWIDALILLPVSVFLLWLYGYSAPSDRTGGDRLADRLLASAAVALAATTLFGLHAVLDVEGLSRNVIAVAAAYLVLLAMLGLGWLRRSRALRLRPSESSHHRDAENTKSRNRNRSLV